MKLKEYKLIFLQERHRFDDTDTVIAECRPQEDDGELFNINDVITVKVVAKPGELVPQLSYIFYGTWRTTKYGRQIHAKTFIRSAPHGRAGIIRYLSQAPHIGPVTAEQLWQKFGPDAVRVVRETPDVTVAAIGGRFTEAKAADAAAFLERAKGTEEASIALVDLLGGRGFPRGFIQTVIHRWGPKAADLIRRNPYLAMQIKGCGFSRADKLYLDLGLDPNRLKRQTLCLWHGLTNMEGGHVWMRREDAVRLLRKKIGGADIRAAKAAKLGVRAGLLAARRDAVNELWLTDASAARAEKMIAGFASIITNSKTEWPELDGLPLSDHQMDQLAMATSRRIGILGGGPGTGKSYATAHLASRLTELHGLDSVCVLAPTGKAAVRVTELLAGYGVPLGATTIHRGLGVASSEGGWTFQHGLCNPLPYQFVLVDESSMIDSSLMASLVSAIAGSLLLVGDVNQLPPVGRGAPLRDLIASGHVAVGELTEVRRNSGRIVSACHQIRKGRHFDVSKNLDPPSGENLTVIPAKSDREAIGVMLHLLGKITRLDPVWDVQVICALNTNGKLSRKNLNAILQKALNNRLAVPGCPFRVGDKIVCLKNGKVPLVADSAREQLYESLQSLDLRWPTSVEAIREAERELLDEAPKEEYLQIHQAAETVVQMVESHFDPDSALADGYVANGELGRVLSIEQDFVIAEFQNPMRQVKIWRKKEEGDNQAGLGNFDLGYALSCHKCQGSEFPLAIVMLDDSGGARRVCSREWLYTSISRAKEACVMIGRMGTAMSMLSRVALPKRKTFLAEQIQEMFSGKQ